MVVSRVWKTGDCERCSWLVSTWYTTLQRAGISINQRHTGHVTVPYGLDLCPIRRGIVREKEKVIYQIRTMEGALTLKTFRFFAISSKDWYTLSKRIKTWAGSRTLDLRTVLSTMGSEIGRTRSISSVGDLPGRESNN